MHLRRSLLAALIGFSVLATASVAKAQVQTATAGQTNNANIIQALSISIKSQGVFAGIWNLDPTIVQPNSDSSMVVNVLSNAGYTVSVDATHPNMTQFNGGYLTLALNAVLQINANGGTPQSLSTTITPLSGAVNQAPVGTSAGRDHTITFSQTVDFSDQRLGTGNGGGTYRTDLTFTATAPLV